MTPTDIEFIKEAIKEIRDHLRTINGRCSNHTTKIAVLTERQNSLYETRKDTKQFIARLLAQVAAGILIAALAYLFGNAR